MFFIAIMFAEIQGEKQVTTRSGPREDYCSEAKRMVKIDFYTKLPFLCIWTLWRDPRGLHRLHLKTHFLKLKLIKISRVLMLQPKPKPKRVNVG